MEGGKVNSERMLVVALWVGGFVCWMDGKVNEYFCLVSLTFSYHRVAVRMLNIVS